MDNILNPKQIEVEIRGEKLSISPLKVKYYKSVMGSISTFIKFAQSGNEDWLSLISDNFDDVLAVLIGGAEKEKDYVESLTGSEAIKLLKAVVEVNADDFLSEMKPQIESFATMILDTQKTAESLIQEKEKSSGPVVSNSSSKTGTDLKKSASTQ